MTLPLLLVLAASCGLCLVLTPVARALAGRCGLVDRPDGRRKIHAGAVPVAGGFAILLAAVAVLAAALLLPGPLAEELAGADRTLLGLLLAAVAICAVGVADDYGCLRGRHKLIGQLVAVLIVIQFGVVVRTVRVFDTSWDLGLLAVPLTALWLLGAVNSLNLIDGLDGLLSSVGLIVALALAGMAALGDKWAMACVALALAGALLGFLAYNFPPASVFLGDSGSMVIGLVVGTLAIQGSLKTPATVALAAPAALLTVPFLDTAAAIVRRKLTGRSIYTTDRGHLHHCLLRRGLSHRRVLLCVALLCLLAVAGALASLAWQTELFAFLAALSVAGILLATRVFGNAEMVLVKKQAGSLLLSFLRWGARGQARQTHVRLQGSADWQGLWNGLVRQAHDLNLTRIRLNVNAPALQEVYHARWERAQRPADEVATWGTDVPLAVGGHILGQLEVVGARDEEPIWEKITRVLALVKDFEVAASILVGGPPRPPAAVPAANRLPGPVEKLPARTC